MTRTGRPTREEAADLEDRLRRAALALFVAGGFDGTTMEAVALAAGVSKRTLYAKYPDKRALFAAVVPWALARMPWADGSLVVGGAGDDLAASLRAVAEAVLALVASPDAVALRRLATMEAHRFPEFAEAANIRFWRQSTQAVVDLLAAADVVVADVELAADQFIAMVAGAATILADLGVFRSPAEQRRHVDHAVTLFLRGVLPR